MNIEIPDCVRQLAAAQTDLTQWTNKLLEVQTKRSLIDNEVLRLRLDVDQWQRELLTRLLKDA